jgi:phosphoserine aminotransferase
MQRVYNFSPGPAMLPESVLRQAQAELVDWHGTGMSVMEISHRGAQFQELLLQISHDVRDLLAIPNNYQILFVAGGASTQFAMVPLNLLTTVDNLAADYLVTGRWSLKAFNEAKRYGNINIAATNKLVDGLNTVPSPHEWQLQSPSAYLHYTPNETVDGLEFPFIPESTLPLVADMTSTIMSKPIPIENFGLIYAGVQKNLGQAGLTIVIIREDLITKPLWYTPTLSCYQTYRDHGSCYNTPPTYAIYIMGLVLQWLKQQGGLALIAERNARKSAKLYACIDQYADFYLSKVARTCRSTMNVVFHLAKEDLTPTFLAEAQQANLVNLCGHAAVGGIRASIYNAMPESGVDLLVNFMHEFAVKYA